MRLALVQTDVAFGDPRGNAGTIVAHLRALAREGADLALFPECALTGYCARSRDEAERIAVECDPGSGPFAEIVAATRETGVAASFGFAERERDRLYNAVLTVVPGKHDATLHRYRKTHLPELGYDRWATPGDELSPMATPWGAIGILICFDLRPPEAARTLALKGTDLIVLPTNWPEGAEIAAEVYPRVRASESGVWLAACNRVGTENGVTFFGRSSIVDPRGRVVASAGAGEEVLIADLDLSLARRKRNVVVPGEFEYEIFASRQPELYTSEEAEAPVFFGDSSGDRVRADKTTA